MKIIKCDICGCKIDKKDMIRLGQDSFSVNIGERIKVEDCCDNCMEQLELCLKDIIRENHHD